MLVRKAKALRGPMIRLPDCLIRFNEKKKMGKDERNDGREGILKGGAGVVCKGFPDIEEVMVKIRSFTNSPLKRIGSKEKLGKKFRF